jgi:Winged helix-turn-helix DNA-binding
MNRLTVGRWGVRMLKAAQSDERWDSSCIVLGLLSSVDRDGGQPQRRLRSRLGIARGLVNSYLKSCGRNGLIKFHRAPARRYCAPEKVPKSRRRSRESGRFSSASGRAVVRPDRGEN